MVEITYVNIMEITPTNIKKGLEIKLKKIMVEITYVNIMEITPPTNIKREYII